MKRVEIDNHEIKRAEEWLKNIDETDDLPLLLSAYAEESIEKHTPTIKHHYNAIIDLTGQIRRFGSLKSDIIERIDFENRGINYKMKEVLRENDSLKFQIKHLETRVNNLESAARFIEVKLRDIEKIQQNTVKQTSLSEIIRIKLNK